MVNYVTELFRDHRTSDVTFQAAIDQLGALGVTELSTLMGYYTMLAFNANSFQIDTPDGGEPKLPI